MAKKTVKSDVKQPKWMRFYPFVLVVGGLLGIYAAMALSIDEIKLIKDPGFQPVCNLNPLLSCTSVISSNQATAAGSIPNPYLGLIGFGIVVAVGMAIFAGAKFKKWYWQGLLAGTFLGVVFIHWLFFQTVYNIGKLCLFCILTWIVTIAIFWYTLLMNYKQGFLPVPAWLRKPADFASRHSVDILISWYLIITLLVLNHFWYYFGPH
jgi:uncharacterized membrane protein